MYCPLCHEQTKVLESRITGHNASMRRRRQCIACKFRFSTIEEMEILDLTVVKRDGSKQTYSHEKLTDGLKKSLHKRPFTKEDIKKLASDIERDIQIAAKDNMITSEKIGELVMKQLKKFDSVAYVRFTSVYRDFKDPADFTKEVADLNT